MLSDLLNWVVSLAPAALGAWWLLTRRPRPARATRRLDPALSWEETVAESLAWQYAADRVDLLLVEAIMEIVWDRDLRQTERIDRVQRLRKRVTEEVVYGEDGQLVRLARVEYYVGPPAKRPPARMNPMTLRETGYARTLRAARARGLKVQVFGTEDIRE